MKNPYSLSVIMPIFNGDKYLREAIDSVLNQTHSDFEFIIINDGSSDNTSQIIHDYAKKDSRIKIIERENRGLIYSLNQGINESENEIIVRMDADDICHPERFEKQLEYMMKNNNIIASGTLVELIDSDGDIISHFTSKTGHDEIDQQHMRGVGGAIVHPSAMIKKAALIEVGLYDDRYPHAEDLDLWLKLAEVGQLGNVPLYLLKYRQHAESIGYTKRNSQLESAENAVYAAYERRGLRFDRTKLKINSDIVSSFDVHMKWAWWSFKINNLSTCRKHAVKSLRLRPWSIGAFKLIILTFIRKFTKNQHLDRAKP